MSQTSTHLVDNQVAQAFLAAEATLCGILNAVAGRTTVGAAVSRHQQTAVEHSSALISDLVSTSTQQLERNCRHALQNDNYDLASSECGSLGHLSWTIRENMPHWEGDLSGCNLTGVVQTGPMRTRAT